jgi:hypothetical protein
MGAIACPGMGAIIACPGMGAICCPDIAPGRVMHSRGGPYVRGVGRVGLVRRYLIGCACSRLRLLQRSAVRCDAALGLGNSQQLQPQ